MLIDFLILDEINSIFVEIEIFIEVDEYEIEIEINVVEDLIDIFIERKFELIL